MAAIIWPSLFSIFALTSNVIASRKPNYGSPSLLPLVINTWPFTDATKAGWFAMRMTGSAMDAVEQGCSKCEVEQCDGTVGYGGSPDEEGHTTLDAMIMDGVTHNVGAVGSLRNTKNAISVARSVMEHTDHTFLVGDSAFAFARSMDFKEESLDTNKSRQIWKDWIKNKCQPNYWKNVEPNPKTRCGPYKPLEKINHPRGTFYKRRDAFYKRRDAFYERRGAFYGRRGVGHDTIGMIAIDKDGNIAAGTSTNGLSHKIPGRVGDSPIAGAGAYVDNDIGAAVATGNGDVMMRFLPSFRAVMNLYHGMSPDNAVKDVMRKIVRFYPSFNGAVVVATKDGKIAAAAHGFSYFKYSFINPVTGRVRVIPVTPTKFN